VRARLAAAVERLRPLAPGVGWVTRDNVHLTVKFLGGVESPRLAAIESALTTGTAGHGVFELSVQGLGAFPTRMRPRVLWAGVADGDALHALGIPRETRPFAAHVTLGRVREPRANPRLAGALDSTETFGRQPVTRISLMRSDLSPRGARYTELAGMGLRMGA